MTEETRESSFDALAKGMASGTISRGKALRLMGAALLGGTLASVPGIASAKPNKPEGAKCKHNFQCASGQCVEGRCGEVCGGEIVTPVGGGDPVCACSGTCEVSCDDCPSGTICTTEVSECGGLVPFACVTAC